MITNLSPSTSTPGRLPFKLHKLTQIQFSAWMVNRGVARHMAQTIVNSYREGVGIVDPRLCLFAKVERNGSILDLPPPLRQFTNADIANKPSVDGCNCSTFQDPETLGLWGERASRGEHHPLCEFNPRAGHTFQRYQTRAMRRLREGKRPTERPDDLALIYEGKI